MKNGSNEQKSVATPLKAEVLTSVDAESSQSPPVEQKSKGPQGGVDSLVDESAQIAVNEALYTQLASVQPTVTEAVTSGEQLGKKKKDECDDKDDEDCDDKGGWLWWAGGLALAGGGAMAFAGGGGGGDSSPDPATVALSGRVTDGPVSGASIYNDVNKNGIYDAADILLTHNGLPITSDGDGYFVLTVGDLSENKIANVKTLKLVAYGGIDTVTGEAVTVDFTAPEGYRYLNPISSLIAAYMEAYNEANPNAKITAAQAEAAVEAALGLPDLDYATTDLADPATAGAAQQAAAILAVAALLVEQSGADSDGFAFLAANLSPAGDPPAGDMAYLEQQVIGALLARDDASAAQQFEETVDAVNASASLDEIGSALMDTIFADLQVQGTVLVGQTLTGELGMGSTAGLEVTYQWLESTDGINWTPIDGETGNSYQINGGDINHHLRLQASYVGTDGELQVILSDVYQIPDSSPVFSSGDSGDVAENADVSTVVYAAQATSPLANNTLVYSLGGADADMFTIDAATGEVTLRNAADFETKESYAINVIATDIYGLTASKTLTVSVDNLDEVAPIFSSGSTADIYENTGSDQIVYTAVADDSADISDGFSFSLKAGSDAAVSIDAATGEVTLSDNPDFEAQPSYSFTVVATDAAGNVREQAVDLAVLNNDAEVDISVDRTAIEEGVAGTSTVLTYTVTRSSSLNASSVDWSLAGVAADDLVNGQSTSGTLNFAVGETSKTFTVEVLGDITIEADETLVVALSNPGADMVLGAIDSATTTIANDDGEVSIAATVVSVLEGNTGDTRVVTFNLTRSNTLSASSVDWEVAGGTVDAADFGGSLPSGTVTFAEGEANKSVTVTLSGDRSIEPDETLTLRLSHPGDNLSLAVSEASTTVTNDDLGFSIFADVTDVVEGGSGTQTAISFHVVRSASLTAAMNVDYRLIPRGSNVPDILDFTGSPDALGNNSGRPSGTVSFAENETSKTITIYVAGDAIPELDETFSIVLDNAPPGTMLINGEIEGVIRNDETRYDIAAVAPSTLEGNGVGGVQQFTITRSGDASEAGSVGYTITNYGENPTTVGDFAAGTPMSGTLDFAAGETSKVLSVNLEGDSLLEGYESFKVSLQAQDSNSIIGTGSAITTINPDDAAVNIAATDSIVKEGTGATANSHTFKLTRSEYLDSEVTVDWQLLGSGGNPVDAADFGGTLPFGSITFAVGETVKTLTIIPSTDAIYELHEGYEIELTGNQLGVVLESSRASGIILNDDSGLTLVATNLDKAEGNPGDSSQLTFTVQRSGDTTGVSTVHWELIPAATDGAGAADFVSGTIPSGDLTFTRGVTSLVVTLPLTTDAIIEADKGFSIRLSSPSEGTELLVSEVGGFIRNDDAAFTLQDVSPVVEGHSGGTNVTFTVVRSGDLNGTDTVDYTLGTVGSGSSAGADDFVGGQFPSGTVSFAVGEASKTFTVAVAGDSGLESDESFTVTLSNPGAGSTIADGSTEVTIVNDDDALSIAATDADLTEAANGASKDFTFTVTRTGFVDRASSVDWSVAGLGADAANAADFAGGVLPSGTLDFAANETSKTITVTVNGDYNLEADEGFRVTLSSASAGTELDTTTADGVIRNDDTGLSIAATTTNLAEGDSGSVTHVFTVTRSGVTTGATTVDWALAGSGGNPVDADDFGGTLPSGTLSFAAGETSKTIEIQVSGDSTIEATEGFTLTLANADGNADILTATAGGTVVADDIAIAISAATATVAEGADGSSRVLQFTVTRTGDLASAVTVDWAASGMDAADFANGTQLSGSISFAANETSKTISLTQIGDNLNESDETLTITLANPAGNPAHDRTYITTGTAATAVVNDDAALTIAADVAAPSEGNTGDGASTAFTFTLTRAGDTSVATDIDWVLQLPGGAGSASGNDFVAGQDDLGTNGGLPSGTISFAAGETSRQITVNVATDDQVEQDETFSILLQGAGDNTELSGSSASAVISNDDTGFSIIALAAEHAEGDSGTTTYTFRVTRAGAIDSAATVDWDVAGSGAAPADAADFGGSLPGGTLSFAADEASKDISFTVSGDTVVEPDEEFTVTIGNAKLSDDTPQTIQDATAVGYILNEDQSFAVSAANATLAEGSAGTTQVGYTITRSGDLSVAATIDYAVTGSGGATAADVQGGTLPSGTLTFGVGVDQLAVTFDVLGDTLAEGEETFTLTLTNASTGIIDTATAATVISNDDTNFTLSAPVPFTEGEVGSTTATFTVTRSGDTSGTGSVQWKVQSAAGLSTADFSGDQDALGSNSGLPSGTVSFAAGETSKDITIQVAGDLVLENDETLRVVLSTPVDGTIEGSAGDKSTTILTDDDSFSIGTLVTSRAEGNSDGTVTYTVTRTGSLDGARDLTWTITGSNGFDTATDLADGQAASGTVSFADGVSSATIVVNVKGDSTVESDEIMSVTLSDAPANSVIGTATASTTLTNDDAGFSIATLLADKNEGNSGYVDYTYTITRSGNTAQTSTVQWAVDTGAGDSVNGSDFYATQPAGVAKDGSGIPYGSLTFASGQTSQTITLRVAGDSTFEADETLRVTLSSPSAGSEITTASADGTVRNDDAQFNITAGTASVAEGDAGHGTGAAFTYTVTRTGNLDQTNTVDWSVQHGTTNSGDFSNGVGANINPSGSLTFAAGETSKTITVYAYGDTGVGSVEGNETFNVVLSNANAGSSLGATSTYASTIVEDDTLLTLSVDDYSKAEATAGNSTTYTYTLTRTGDLSKTTDFTWAASTTDPGYASNYYLYDQLLYNWSYQTTASDFSGAVVPNGSGSFASGDGTKTFSVTVAGDDAAENNEWFAVSVTASSGYDEIKVVYDDSVANPGSTLLRTNADSRYYYDGTAVSSAANKVATSTNYIFSEIIRDEAEFRINDYEITAEGSPTSYHTINSRAEGDSLADGGAGGTVEHIFAVERTIATAGDAWVTWRVVGSNGVYQAADAADFAAGSDARGIGALASGTLNFVDGQRWGYIKVYTNVDDVGEYDEGFRVYLDGVSGGSSIYVYDNGGYNQNIGYIKNDDTRFDASVNNVTEGGTLTYTITRSGDMRGTDTVDWSLTLPGAESTNESDVTTSTWYKLDPSDISDVQASNGTVTYTDGTRTYSGTLTFTDGETTKTVTVATIDDSWTETWREELSIALSNATNVDAGEANHDLETAATGTNATARVYDNEPDPLISVSVSSASTYEGTGASDAAAGNSVTFTVTRTDQADRDGALDYPTTVAWRIDGNYINWSSAAGSAEVMTFGGNATGVQEPSYNQTFGLVTFAAGETSKNVVVTFYGDRYVEDNRTLTFTVLNPDDAEHWPLYTDAYGPANIDPAAASVTTTLLNDDIRLWVGGWDTYNGDANGYYTNVTASAYEGNPLTFSVIRGGRLDSDVEVSYTLTHGTTAAGDFQTTSGSFTLAARPTAYGEYTYNISLADILADDTTVESDEAFTLVLNTPADAAGSAVRFQSYYLDASNSYTTPSTTLNVSGTIRDDDSSYSLVLNSSASQVETDQGANQTYSFTVNRGGTGYTGPATLKWKVEAIGGNTVDASDFTSTDSLGVNGGLPSGTVSFANGVLTGNFSVLIKGDLIAESDETFRVVLFEDTLSGPSPSITNSQTVASATLTVLTDDTGISIADAGIVESDANQTLNFTVTRSGDLSGASTMNWGLNHGTTAAGDFTGATSGSISFAAGESSKTISVTVVGDTAPEADETFSIQLSALTGVDEAIDVNATGTIRNDDSAFNIAGDDASTAESGSQTFTLTRTHDTAQDQTVNWSVVAGSASADDFGGTLPSGSVTFASGEMSKTVTVTPTSDATPESDETYTVNITLGAGTTGDTITTATATGTILNDDAAINLAADQTTKLEGHSATSAFTFTVTRSGNTSGETTVDWALSSANAVAADFATADDLGSNAGLPSGTVTFADGEATRTITIEVVGDEVVEGDEAFTITLSNATGGTIFTGSAGSTIVNDDSTIALSADSAVKAEGNSGTTPYTFTITRSGYLGEAETVDYTVAGSGANPADGSDFSGTSGTVTLAAGQASTTLTINVNGDLAGEADEDFTVTLSNPSSGVTITTAAATGTIQADDIVFDVTAPPTQLEGNPSDITYFDFVVIRSGNLSGTQTLNWSVAGIGADGTSASDFDSTSGTVTFNPDDTSQTISVPVAGDYLGEADENFRLTLTGPDGVVFTHSTADAVITDDEASLRISATDAVKAEGADGTTSYTFTVTRTGNTDLEATVDWAVAGDTAAADDFDGGALPSGSLTFASGVNSQTITVQVAGDTTVESNEAFTVELANASTGADIVAGSAGGTIVSDDVEWTVAALTIPSTEGDGASNYVFRVTRTGSLSATTLDWSTAGSGTEAATSDDFVGNLFPSGTLVFAQGQSSQDFTVQVAGDSSLEADEGFRVTLAASADGLTHSYATQSADVTIANDDDVLSIAALDAERGEGTSSSTAFTFTVTRAGSLAGESTVGWRIVHGDTTAADFVATSGTASFADGEDTATISVMVSGDRDVEGAEAFAVELYNPGAGSTVDGAAATASGLIANDDVDLSLAAASASVTEGDSGNPGQATFTVTRSGDLTVATSVDWSVVAGTATAADFAGGVLPGGTLVFAAGETSKTIAIDLAGDGAWEGNETFTVRLSDASAHADIVNNNVTGQILDDDDTLSLAAVAVEHAEGNAGTVSYTFRIDRSGTATGATSVDWVVAGNGEHPTSADDIVAASGTVNFADGETSKIFTVEVAGDTLGEYDETFGVSLVNPAYGSTVAGNEVTATVLNDDAVLFVSADHAAVAEGADGVETTFTFTVTRSGDISGASSALWEIVGSGSHPANAADFGGVFPSGAVAFQPGESTQQISLTVLGDAVGEFDETFSVVLSDPEGATILEGTAETTIANDDTGISITALDADKAEGNSGATPFTFQVERVGLAEGEVSVSWAVQGSGSYPAGIDDFVDGVLPSGTVNFADGESVKTITIDIAGDETYGQDQTFRVVLSNAVGANLINNDATGIIRNDDSQISIAALDASQVEGDSGGTLYRFVLTREGAADVAATIDWAVVGSGGHQANAADFVGNSLPSGSVTFAAGEMSKTITVAVAGDTLTEVDEEFAVQLLNPGAGVSIEPNAGAAVATILSDDEGVVLIGLDVDRREGDSGTQTAFTYQVLRSGNIDAPVTLDYTVDGDVDADDFVSPLTGSFEMAAGENSHLLTLTVNGDATVEPDEFFQVTLSGTGINIDSTPVTGVIRGDDEAGDGNDVIYAAADADTISAGGGNDSIHLTVDNLAHLQETAGTLVDGGAGLDTLLFDATGQEFDLMALVANDAFTGIEKIDLTGGANTLILTTAEILHQDQDVFAVLNNGVDSFHQLMIEGDGNDEVIIGDIADWSHAPTDTYSDGGAVYDVYTNHTDHTQLLIDQAITNVHGEI